MENKIHDDQLDDYVRRSFEDYEEDPASGMWGRVKGDLLPQAEPRLSYVRRYLWQAAAAAAILLLVCGLVCEHFYYEKKIRALEVQKIEIQESTKRNADVFSEKNDRSNTQQHVGEHSFSKQKLESPTSNHRNPESALDSREATHIQPLPPNRPLQRDDSGVKTPDSPQFQNQTKSDSHDAASVLAGQKSNIEQQNLETPPPTESTPTFVKPVDFEPLVASFTLLKIPTPTAPNPIPAHIEPVRKLSSWYVGLQTTPRLAFDNTSTPVRRPGGRPIFVSKQETPDFSTDLWLKIGKKLNSRFSLESGVGYSELSRTATHTPRFRFFEGVSGGNPLRRNFEYDLNTYGGSAAVSLRMEQLDSTPVPDDEPISLKITTSERTQVLRIPLLLAYRIGAGRLHGNVKAGLTGNFFLKNELDIFAQISQNDRFRPVQGGNGYTVQLDEKGTFFLGYWLSAGAEFRLTSRVSFMAEPSFSGDFPRKDAAGRRLPGHFSVGLNVGTNYYF